MSDQELEMLEQEEGQIEEAKKASFGDPSEVPDPSTKEVEAPGGEAEQGDSKGAKATSPTAVPKTKVALMSSIQQTMAGYDKSALMAMYKSMNGMGEEVEADTTATSIKEIKQISASDVDVAEDVQAMFSGEDLSEDFTSKATTIFEAAVVSKVNEILESVTVDLEAELEAEKEGIIESMTSRLDDYMEYVVEEWMKENELAVEQGIRAEIAENFMVGLRNLFTESYIDIPEEKADLVDELAAKVAELEESINEEVEKNIASRKELAEAKKAIVLRDVTEGLTESQVVKMKSLAEGVEFESAEDYAKKLETIKENYFPQEEVSEEDTSVDAEPVELEEETEVQIDPQMKAFTDAISRSIKK
jgi:Mg2+ and Co2+ transporter CorA